MPAFSRQNPNTTDFHLEERTKILEGYGLRVVRFTNEEVMNCFESVCGEIENLTPPTPLKKGG
jgi:very-short-patch-repair endonuclease